MSRSDHTIKWVRPLASHRLYGQKNAGLFDNSGFNMTRETYGKCNYFQAVTDCGVFLAFPSGLVQIHNDWGGIEWEREVEGKNDVERLRNAFKLVQETFKFARA